MKHVKDIIAFSIMGLLLCLIGGWFTNWIVTLSLGIQLIIVVTMFVIIFYLFAMLGGLHGEQ
jgi:ABC-type multidrug transport system permease subunit